MGVTGDVRCRSTSLRIAIVRCQARDAGLGNEFSVRTRRYIVEGLVTHREGSVGVSLTKAAGGQNYRGIGAERVRVMWNREREIGSYETC